MDALSHVLSAVRVTGAIYFDAEFSAPWGVDVPESSTMAQKLSPGTEHLVSYHLVVEGELTAKVEGARELHLKPGHLLVMPHGDRHLMWNGANPEFSDTGDVLGGYLAGDLIKLKFGGGGTPTRIICGFFGCDRQTHDLVLAGLPPALGVDVRGDSTGAWIESSIRHLVGEAGSQRVGAAALMSRMAEALFVESLRRWVDGLPDGQTGWLAGARDPVVGRALTLIHRDIMRTWTSDDLAREAATSRTVLAERFQRILGEGPSTYLARTRLQAAARLLETTRKPVVQVAADVGYESEAAFNRAFKRQFGEPPARFRRKQQAANA